MKWGLICPVCDRLLWTQEKRFGEEVLLTKGMLHGIEKRPPNAGDTLIWCGCKPSRLKQQDLVEAR